MMTKPIAVIIPNYNMREYALILKDKIRRDAKWPHEIIVVENGSDKKDWAVPEHEAEVRLRENVEMTHGILIGLAYADALEAISGAPFFAYWIVTTSMRFRAQDIHQDPLTPLASFLNSYDNVAMVSAALTKDSECAFTDMHWQGDTHKVRSVWGVDNICVLIRADWFNRIGRYEPDLTMGWGSSFETCWKARRNGMEIYVHDGVVMHKDTGIAHAWGRRPRSAQERAERGSAEMERVLSARYGDDYLERLGHEFRR